MYTHNKEHCLFHLVYIMCLCSGVRYVYVSQGRVDD